MRRLWWAAALAVAGLIHVAVVVFIDGKAVAERWTPALRIVVSVLGLLSTLVQSQTGSGEDSGSEWLKGRADALAGAVEEMWAAEARLRRLRDPPPHRPHPRAGLPTARPGQAGRDVLLGPGCNGATRAALALAELGYQVEEMLGGFEYWVREGLEFQTWQGRECRPADPLTAPVAAENCGC